MRRLLLCILMLVPAQAMAAVELKLPLEGYWRPGRYMPVQVSVRDAGTSIDIGGDGVIPVRLPLRDGRFDGVVPLLVMSEPRGIGDRPMRQLRPQQRMVGFTTIDMQFAQKLFPDEMIVPIQLSTSDPIAGPAAAWEMLDAVVLDNAVSEQKLRELAACGVIVARRSGEISKSNIIGPRAAAEDLAAFAPVGGWAADWPAAFRRSVILCALAFSIIALGVGLMRFKCSALILIALCAAVTIGLWMWWKNRPSVLTKCGTIIVREGALAQRDLWVYQATASGSESHMPWVDLTRPYFESRLDREAMKPLLLCDEEGIPRSFEFHLRAGQKIGFCVRKIMPTPQMNVGDGVSVEMGLLAKRMYLGSGAKIAGESDWKVPLVLPKYSQQFPTVVMDAAANAGSK